MNKAFTLIELLVVVLIIGILSAVALPQYEKAVRKTRIAEAKIILKKLTEAQDVYFLSNNELPPSFTSVSSWNEVLDINIPQKTQYWTISIDECVGGCANHAYPKWESGYAIGYASPNYDGETKGHFFCCFSNSSGEKICKELGGTGSDTTYILP